MIKGMGCDLIEIKRIAKALQSPRFAERILTPKEREYCLAGKLSPERAAGRFAAKEATAKALGGSFSWHEVEVLSESNGKPTVVLHGKAKQSSAGGKILITITHTKEHAMAVALWTSEDNE